VLEKNGDLDIIALPFLVTTCMWKVRSENLSGGGRFRVEGTFQLFPYRYAGG
jgi:hypothetical protein